MPTPAHTLVVAAGDVDVSLLAELVGGVDRPRIIAADGGATRLLNAGLTPDTVVGDFDSLSAQDRLRLEHLGVELVEAAPDKDESDTELCLLAALEAEAVHITILGALGLTRPEHSVANLLLLADPRLDGIDVAIAGRGSRITRMGTADGPGHVAIDGEPGDFVSLLAMDAAVEGVTTVGLRFRLVAETLLLGPSRGLSNELLGSSARVTSRRGRLLVIHTSRSMADASPTGEN